MAQISVKILALVLYNFLLIPVAQVAAETLPYPPTFMYYMFMSLIILPEVTLIVSKSARSFVADALQKGDGRLDTTDLKDLLGHYGTFWCVRVFVIMSLTPIFFSTDIDIWKYVLCFVGMGLTESRTIAKAFMKREL